MISIKTPRQIQIMRENGKILSDLLEYLETEIVEGITTLRLDSLGEAFIERMGAKAAFKGMYGFPNALCISIDDEVIHGVPSALKRLEEGQLVSIDGGVLKDGLYVDAARTFIVGKTSEQKQKLVNVTRESFFKAVSVLKNGATSGDLGFEIESHAKKNGFSVVRQYNGHGVGLKLHEDPDLPNFGSRKKGCVLKSGMTLAIEPMLNMGWHRVYEDKNGHTVKTIDESPSAHYENTVLVTLDGCEILTERA